MNQDEKNSAELRMMKRARDERKFVMRARLAKRDLDYAESGHAAPVTVEERDLRNSELGQIIRVETRGRACIGAFSANHYTHS